MVTNLDLVNACDRFPYPDKDPQAYASYVSTLYTLVWKEGGIATPIGLITEGVCEKLMEVPEDVAGKIELDLGSRQISMFQQATEIERSQKAAALASYWRERKTFQNLGGWRDELYPVYGPGNKLLYSIERSASTLLGIVTYGVHMTAYTKSPDSSYGMKLWIPRRAGGKQTYGGMLDNTVAGGMATNEEPLGCLVRECEEEASLSNELVKTTAKAHGAITYIYIANKQAGGEVGLVQPECEYIYDLELPNDVIPTPNDSEVEQFYLWTVEEVQEHLAKAEFKPNCALVILDFFIRHGVLKRENEKDYDEIKRRIRRRLEFPGPHLA